MLNPDAVIFVRPDAPPITPEGSAPVTSRDLLRALNSVALGMAREALLTPEEHDAKLQAMVTFYGAQLSVIDQAARQWPACSPAFPSLEEALAGIKPPDRTCKECTCWRRYYNAWKAEAAPRWWPNPDGVPREELEAWISQWSSPGVPREAGELLAAGAGQ